MIDNFSIFFFGGLIIYTVFKAIKLDKLIPWFHAPEESPSNPTFDEKKIPLR